MSEVGYSLEPGAQEAADKGVFLWGLLISQSSSHRADSPNVLVGSWARQEGKWSLMHSPARIHLSQDWSYSTCIVFPRARCSSPGLQVRKLGGSPFLFSRSHCPLEFLGPLSHTPKADWEPLVCVCSWVHLCLIMTLTQYKQILANSLSPTSLGSETLSAKSFSTQLVSTHGWLNSPQSPFG